MRKIDELSNKLTKGTIDRRTFMTSAIALGLTVSAASTLATKAEAATPKSGGHMRVGQGHGSTTDTLDPATHENGFTSVLVATYADHLTEIGEDGQLRGEIAESYEASADAATWRFKIRKGVEFHNGKTLTPDDVVASLNHHRGEDSKSAAKALLSAVTDISIDGDYVVVQLNDGNADFPFMAGDYHLPVLPSADGKIDWSNGIGSGRYKIENFEPGVRAEYTKHANDWKEGTGHVAEFTQLSIIDVTARQNALMNGEVDVIDRVDPKTVHLLQRVPIIDILEATGTLHYTFPMRLSVEPFGNYDLRMALKYSIKRQELIDKILLGHGAMGNDHPISTANQYHNGELEQREFDADKAAFHYKKSGHSGAIQLSSSDAAFAGAVDAAQLIKASAAEAGIDIEVIREPSDGYWSNVWNKKGWGACYWGGRPTEDWMFAAAYVETTEWNDTAWKGTEAADRFNKLVLEARKELDTTKRRAMYYECQSLINDDGGTICPMFANYIMGLNKKVKHGDQIAANWELDGSKLAERWWIDG